MNKQSILLFVLCNLVPQQHSAFHVSSKLLQPTISTFSENFLRVAQHNPHLLQGVQVFSQALLEKPVEDTLLRLQCEDGVDVRVGVMQSVLDNQEEFFQELQEEGALVGVLPDCFEYLDWQAIYDNDGEWTGKVKFVENYEYDSFVTAVLFTYHTKHSRVALFGKEHESFVIPENSSTQNNLNALQEKFRSWLQRSTK